jgi:hypothetical protein
VVAGVWKYRQQWIAGRAKVAVACKFAVSMPALNWQTIPVRHALELVLTPL